MWACGPCVTYGRTDLGRFCGTIGRVAVSESAAEGNYIAILLTMLSNKCHHIMGSITPRRRWLNGGSLRFLSISSSSVHQHTKSPFITTTQANNHNDMLCCITQHLQPSINNHYCQQLSSFSTKVRRRRRDGGGVSIPIDIEENNDDDAPSPTTTTDSSAALSSQQFHIEANLLLDKVESAMIKLLDYNNGLEIERHPPTSFISTDSASNDDSDADADDDDENNNQQPQEHSGQLSIQVESSGDLYWGGGTYWLTIQSEGHFVTLQSLSGSYTYVYNTSTKEWVGDEDGHSLLGMLTRDWIRQAKGVPDF